MSAAIELRPATAQDWPDIEQLLRSHALPLDGAREHLPTFLVALRDQRVIGVAGIEVHGEAALLRSVAVQETARRSGVGRLLVARIVDEARARRLSELYLLTTTAADYFAACGFARRPRESAPAALQSSAEFQGACPAAAVFMSRRLI